MADMGAMAMQQSAEIFKTKIIMTHKKHSIEKDMQSLMRKHDCRITKNRKVLVLKGHNAKNDLGNKSWGKIDYLTNHCDFEQIFVNNFDDYMDDINDPFYL